MRRRQEYLVFKNSKMLTNLSLFFMVQPYKFSDKQYEYEIFLHFNKT